MNTTPLNDHTDILTSSIVDLAHSPSTPESILFHGLDTLGIPHFWIYTFGDITELSESNPLECCALMAAQPHEEFWRGRARIVGALYTFINAQPDDRMPLYEFYLDWLIHLDYLLFGRSDDELLLDSNYQRLVLPT